MSVNEKKKKEQFTLLPIRTYLSPPCRRQPEKLIQVQHQAQRQESVDNVEITHQVQMWPLFTETYLLKQVIYYSLYTQYTMTEHSKYNHQNNSLSREEEWETQQPVVHSNSYTQKQIMQGGSMLWGQEVLGGVSQSSVLCALGSILQVFPCLLFCPPQVKWTQRVCLLG